MRLKLGAAIAILFLYSPGRSLAINSPVVITPPGTAQTYLYNGNSIQVYMEAGRSYACTLNNAGGIADVKFRAQAELGSEQLTGEYIGDVSPVNANGTVGLVNESRISFQPSQSGRYNIAISSSLELSSLSSPYGSITCVETTLYGGFNTNASDLNFLELTNSTSSAIAAKVQAIDSEGSVVIDNETLTVEAGTRKDLDLHSLVGEHKYGTIVVSHDGPFGAIKARVSHYKTQQDESILPTSTTALSARSDVSPEQTFSERY